MSGALLFMGLQFWVGLKIRRYAQYLDRKELQAKMEAERRLGGVENTCIRMSVETLWNGPTCRACLDLRAEPRAALLDGL